MMKMHKFKFFNFNFIRFKILLNFSSNCSFISIKFIRLRGDLQLSLGSLNQFLLKNIIILKFFKHNELLLRLASMSTKEKKKFSISNPNNS